MQINVSQTLWLDASARVTLDDLIALSGFTQNEVLELVDADALAPIDPSAATWTFSGDCVATVRKASRLRDEMELDMHALAVALNLLEQIRLLEADLSQLRAQQPSFRRS